VGYKSSRRGLKLSGYTDSGIAFESASKYTEDMQRLQKALPSSCVSLLSSDYFNTTTMPRIPDRLYELYAAVVHIGGGSISWAIMFSIIKTQDRGWLLFDDEMVEPVDKKIRHQVLLVRDTMLKATRRI